jgi:hypothetical protein
MRSLLLTTIVQYVSSYLLSETRTSVVCGCTSDSRMRKCRMQSRLVPGSHNGLATAMPGNLSRRERLLHHSHSQRPTIARLSRRPQTHLSRAGATDAQETYIGRIPTSQFLLRHTHSAIYSQVYL